MKIAIVIYDDFSLLNLAKLSNFLNKFDNLNIKICAFKNEIKSKFGICIKPDIFNESLDGFDCVMVSSLKKYHLIPFYQYLRRIP